MLKSHPIAVLLLKNQYTPFHKKQYCISIFNPIFYTFDLQTLKLQTMKTFRFFCYIVATCLLISLPSQAKNEGKVPPLLVGLWQQAVLLSSDPFPNIKYTSFYKALNEDGSFFNLVVPGTDERGYFTQHGSFEVQSDTTYVEKIQDSPFNQFKNKDSVVKYRLDKDGKVLYLEWFEENSKTWVSEMWIKVETPKGRSRYRNNIF